MGNFELVVLSFIASLGFGIVFQIKKEDLIYAGIGGAITRIVYLILMAIIALGATTPDAAIWYMLAYFFGFAIPFFVLSFFITRLSWIRTHSQKIIKVGGWVMIAVGVLLFFDGLTYIITIFLPIFDGFKGF